ncbi:hypothetical protein J6E39_02955 [bacterium]|nr:hypothetical protein [bacterium]
MKIDRNDNIPFQKIYYTKCQIFDSEMLPIKVNPKHYAIEENPLPIAKDIMKSSKLFRDLDNCGTDMFVYTDCVPHKGKLLGVLSSRFLNPYTNKVDTLSIQADGFSKETIFEKIKDVADKLPYINELRENFSDFLNSSKHPVILRTPDQWWIAYNK